MKQKQALMKAFAALTLLVAGSALPANAQFGSLKGLANKAKKAVKEKVNDTKNGAKDNLKQQAEGSVNEVAGTNGGNESRGASSSSSTSAAEPKKNIHMWVSERDYRRAKHVDWDYTSSTTDIINDMAYWLKRLRASAEKDDKSQLDLEALDRLTKGRPSFDIIDEEYGDDTGVENVNIGTWKSERRYVVRAAIEIRDNVELLSDLNWQINNSTDEEKALKKEITTDIHKAILLKRYQQAVQMNRYGKAISGSNAWVNKLVKDNFPEWGKIVASKINTDYKVNYKSPGVPKSRYHSAVVMCQDQGYKVLHYIQLSQPYKGGGKYGNSEVRYGGMKWSEAVTIVK
jgi:hypothetical protein